MTHAYCAPPCFLSCALCASVGELLCRTHTNALPLRTGLALAVLTQVVSANVVVIILPYLDRPLPLRAPAGLRPAHELANRGKLAAETVLKPHGRVRRNDRRLNSV